MTWRTPYSLRPDPLPDLNGESRRPPGHQQLFATNFFVVLTVHDPEQPGPLAHTFSADIADDSAAAQTGRATVHPVALLLCLTGCRRAHSDLGPMWYSNTSPPIVMRTTATPIATSHHWSKASAYPSTLADSAIANGQ